MSELSTILHAQQKQTVVKPDVVQSSPQPILFQLADDPSAESKLIKLLHATQLLSIEDRYVEQLQELFFITHPTLEEESVEAKHQLSLFIEKYQQSKADFIQSGTWVFYPWTNRLVHFLEFELYQQLRTARNKLLVTEKEQKLFQNFIVGIAGLSIGNSVALALSYSGGCQTMKLADPDVFAGSNLNRVRVPAHYIGVKKVFVAAQQIYELNPYANLVLYPEGIHQDNLKDFLIGQPKLQLVVDEMDNLKMKIFIRLAARACHLPVVMTTDNGDNAIIDIDRFDLKDTSVLKDLPPMDIGTVISGMNTGESLDLNIRERVRFSTNLVGAHNATPRMQESLMQVSKQIPSWPQLGIAAFIGGSALAYVIKKIAIGEQIDTGKYHLKLDQTFLRDYDSPDQISFRSQKTQELLKHIHHPDFIPNTGYQIWQTQESDYPQKGSLADKIKFILRYAVMAPSSHNTQPWRFVINDRNIELYADMQRSLVVSDPTNRELYVSLGSCLANLLVALAYFGFQVEISYSKEFKNKLVATITIKEGGQVDQKLAQLFSAISKRASDRSQYLPKPVPATLTRQLINRAKSWPELSVSLTSDQQDKNKIADLICQGGKTMMASPEFRQELSLWIRHNFSRQADGMPGSNFGMNDIQSMLGPFLMKHFNMGDYQSEHDRQLVASSPLLVTISSQKDNPQIWLQAGQLYQQLLLLATSKGVSSTTMASVVEIGDLSKKLSHILMLTGRPQVFIRLGYSQATLSHSPRLPLEEVIVKQ